MAEDARSADSDAPRIEFPCLYPIKIIGRADYQFEETVIKVVERHTGKIDAELIKVQNSRANNYLSVTVTIAATGEEQLRNIFVDLKQVESVKLVL